MKARAKRTETKGKAATAGRGKRSKAGPVEYRQLEQHLGEARAQLAATSDVLRVIASSPDDVQPVFDMMAERAMRLCGALHGGVLTFDGELIHLTSHVHASPEFADALRRTYPMPPGRQTAGGRAVLTGATVHIPDIEADPDHDFGETARAAGFRSSLAVPMLHDGRVLGAIVVLGGKPKPFSEHQLHLLQTFANQAVIAIQNARLFQASETRNRALTESLEQQTATSEILRVISGSPTDVQPVFDAIARSAASLCEATNSGVFRFTDGLIQLAAHHNWAAEELEAVRRVFPTPPGRGNVTARAILTLAVAHVTDLGADPEYAATPIAQAGFRTVLSVPMLQEGRPIGAITVTRMEARPFTDRQIALLQTFAAQAVIAIENVRLFTDLDARNSQLRVALEQQTATSEILRVISSSPTDVQPVFDMLARSARQLCDGQFCFVLRFDGARLHFAACDGLTPEGLRALQQDLPRPADEETAAGRSIQRLAVAQIPDVLVDPAYGALAVARAVTYRSLVAVPVVREGHPIGSIVVARSPSGLFPGRQIELLKTFADQAVIAVENVRLFQELEARNRDLTATSEILRVISSSPTDVQPVFDTIAASARRLCDGLNGALLTYDGSLVHLAALDQVNPEGAEGLRRAFPMAPSRSSSATRAILYRQVVQVADVLEDPEYVLTPAAQAAGFRSVVSVPMLREGSPIGTITVTRAVAGSFPDNQIALLQTFADQAVIAIENVRLFKELDARNRELTESLEQQTATSEILRVISSSPTDIQPIFDAIAERALRLCGGLFSGVFRFDGELMHIAAGQNWTPDTREGLARLYPMRPGRMQISGRAVLSRAVVLVDDLITDPEYSSELALAGGWRSAISVPMLRHGDPIGAINVIRGEVKPFSDNQVALLQTFADQAVIAIENVRLFKELETRNRDLTASLEQQTATGEILRVISSSPTDIQPVLDSVAESAARLCESVDTIIFLRDGDSLRLAAHHGAIPAHSTLPLVRGTANGRATLDARTVHVPDMQAETEDFPESSENARRMGHRTMLCVPMVREGVAIGTIQLRRTEAQPFTERQVTLLQTFADQAVIAIENVRLFKEIETRNRDLSEALAQQTATSEVLKVISRSTFDLESVLQTLIENAAHLCHADGGVIYKADGDLQRMAAAYNISPEFRDFVAQNPLGPGPGTAVGRAMIEGRTIHIEDVREDPSYTYRGMALGGYRTILGVPMLREGVPIGVFSVWRTQVAPFTDKQMELITTFADQGAIAIENVRLFQELEARNRDLTVSLEQQTATAEVLRVIAGAQTDAQPVFDTIATNAMRLCGATNCAVFRFDGELIHVAALQNVNPDGAQSVRRAYPLPPSRGNATARAILTRDVVDIPDVREDPEYQLQEMAAAVGFQSVLAVPMLREGNPIGAISVTATGAATFSDSHRELLRTFADQAVIAVENVWLFRELETRTHELTRSVRELRALGEVSQAVTSTLDLETVLATIVSRAVQLSGSDQGVIWEFDEATQSFHMRAADRVGPELLESLRAAPIRLGQGAIGRTGETRQPVEVLEIEDETELLTPAARGMLLREGMRSLLAVPLVREERLLGTLAIGRRQPGAFPPDVVATLRTFATQSVLAIHNARLFHETERQKRYSETLVETSPVAIVTTDLHFAVAGWNPGAERLFGYTPAEAIGRPLEDLVATPAMREEFRAAVQRGLRGQRLQTITRRARKDGSLVDVEISAMPVVVEGAQVGFISIYHDITELLEARREAEAANEAKSAFLATMSHEIRTPMNAVIGMSGLLLNTELSDEQREYAEVVRQSGDALLTVINDILDFSKIEAGKLELESQPFDLRECVESALDLVATRAAEKSLDLAYLIGDGTPAAFVGDVTRLRQILLNLLSNAVKFTERGEVVLSVSATRLDADGPLHEVTFAVRDTGIGIPPERLGRLFQSFSQVDASTTRRYGGTGLGLAISQRLTELMGGQISVTSAVGVGSEFRFTIRAAAALVPVPTRRDLSGVQPSLRGKRVLVVDDNATNRRILTSHLDAWGMRSRATESPREALGWIRGGEGFDVGILDMHMPEMDGVALARGIREHRSADALPLILFTSLGRREARADSEGFASYLHKPIKPSQLFDALVSVLAEQPVHVEARGVTRSELDGGMAGRHPLRILLAEDNVVNQKVALRLLGQMGYRADVAGNGLEAIDAIERQTYDVVLMDVQMPELDGFGASREINRRWPDKRRPRIVAMTANAMQGDRELCEAAGMDDYVAKPIRVEELIAALERCRWRSDAAAGSAPTTEVAPTAAPAPLAVPGAASSLDPASIEGLTSTMGGAFIAELIDTFGEDARELIATLRRAHAAADLDGFRRAAHSLKSTSETLGATILAGMARELENMARAGTIDGAGERIERLAAEYHVIAHLLGEVRRGLSA